jgi:hypothetical protein
MKLFTRLSIDFGGAVVGATGGAILAGKAVHAAVSGKSLLDDITRDAIDVFAVPTGATIGAGVGVGLAEAGQRLEQLGQHLIASIFEHPAKPTMPVPQK